ncbi:MAG: hypothetical protein ACTSP2_10125, partial [Alphaproteobacteria bacterium]
MKADLAQFVSFHLTGGGADIALSGTGSSRLRPALLSGYRNLQQLRYDYPVILVDDDTDGPPVRSLSRTIDGVLQECAPRGMAGEAFRKHVLRLEEEIRFLMAGGESGTLSHLWDLATERLLSAVDGAEQKEVADKLAQARQALPCDGPLIDCDEETPVIIVAHMWTTTESNKARRVLGRIDALILKLSGILKADFLRSAAAWSSQSLSSSVGAAYESAFDFDAWSGLLQTNSPHDTMSTTRRERLETVLGTLKSQRFFSPADRQAAAADDGEAHGFVYVSCALALDAFRQRLPEAAELVKALSIAELEIENQYQGDRHDPFFAQFDAASLAPEDLALFPSYLVCVKDWQQDARETATVIEALSSGLPIKVLVETDDILGGAPADDGRLSFGVGGARIASMAVGLTDVHVLQSSCPNLYEMRDQLVDGLAYTGPA